jgi:hypothetical protein
MFGFIFLQQELSLRYNCHNIAHSKWHTLAARTESYKQKDRGFARTENILVLCRPETVVYLRIYFVQCNNYSLAQKGHRLLSTRVRSPVNMAVFLAKAERMLQSLSITSR